MEPLYKGIHSMKNSQHFSATGETFFPIIDTLSLAHLNSNFVKTLHLIKCKQKHIFSVFFKKAAKVDGWEVEKSI